MKTNPNPPTLALRFFRWYCHPKLVDSIEGDLLEEYNKWVSQKGKWRAAGRFCWEVLLLFRPGIIRPMEGYQSVNTFGMFKNYFKISLRQLAKNKGFAFVNIAGLTLGFTCFLLLALYVFDELSFDQFHRDAGRIVRVMQHDTQDDGSIRSISQVSPLLGHEAAVQFEEVEAACRMSAFGRVTLGNDPDLRSYERIWSPADNFFLFFDFPLVEGDAATALKGPDAIVINETLARKYFGHEPALGKTLWSAFTREGEPVYLTVTGVMKDLPKNSHLQFSILFSEATWPSMFRWYPEYVSTDWQSSEYVTYLKLRPGADVPSLTRKINEMVKRNYPADKDYRSTFSLMALSDVHFHQDNAQDNELNANSIKPFYLYLFAAVGALLLLIACLNYMNLSTAAALKRTHEIGTRKSLGALKGQLVGQFVTDSLLLSILSLALAVLLVQGLLPAVNRFAGKEIALTSLPLSWMLLTAGLLLLTGLLSALYPAFVSTRVSAVEAMKREIRWGGRSLPVRKVLLAVQFAISMMMIASTLVIYRQLDFMRTKDLGFSHENLLVVDINSGRLRRDFETVKAEFSKPSEVVSITASTRVPGEWKGFPVATVHNAGDPKGREMIFVGIDKDFLHTYGIRLLEGRTIEDPQADSLKIVLTKMAVQQLGLTHPIGQRIEMPQVRYGGSREVLDKPFQVEVIGVVEDFHFESLRQEMMPVVFGAPNTAIQRIDYYTLRVKTAHWNETLQKLKTINAQIDADNPLEYTFLDSRFADLYQADARRGQIFLILSVVVVVIACMGLFALVSYAVESRTKEIGVRKVLGASATNILQLISGEFLVLVIAGGAVGLPVAWYVTRGWLQEFAYRAPIGLGLFALAVVMAVVIALLTISVRTLRAARVNPVESLRSE
ncbi:MAG: ABC transporter permease [Cyclobacteriaceae bacterium]|nr:ABC transporter permease [Cyclobacteriaceae bacterium]